MLPTRDAAGNLQVRKDKFPKGIKYLADYAHSKKLKLGIYSAHGNRTCCGNAGSFGHWCGARVNPAAAAAAAASHPHPPVDTAPPPLPLQATRRGPVCVLGHRLLEARQLRRGESC